MIKKILTLLFISTGLLLLTSVTSPVNATLPIYLAVFSLVYFFFVVLFLIIISLTYAGYDKSKQYFFAVVLGFSPTILLALASLSTISIIDVVLALGVPMMIVWYGVKRGVIK